MRIVHCFREPVGGLFRHVGDLAEAQHAAGHQVGIVCDASTGGPLDEATLERLRPKLGLGLTRFAMRRHVAPSDFAAVWRITRLVRPLNPDILHGHGAKGGAYGRMIGSVLRASGKRVARIYTPHGGSLHFDPASAAGRVYFTAERLLGRMTDALLFVSQYEADAYAAKIGKPTVNTAVVRNGVGTAEFEPVAQAPDAADFLFIGALRGLKGPDIFIEALALLRDSTGKTPTALVVGSGEEKGRYVSLAAKRGLADFVRFRDPMPVRSAFALARNVIVPSRAESMPYIVLEAIAAGMPLVATHVGGIPEIFGTDSGRLVAPGEAGELANAMAALLRAPEAARARAARLKTLIRRSFSIAEMAAGIERVYREANPR